MIRTIISATPPNTHGCKFRGKPPGGITRLSLTFGGSCSVDMVLVPDEDEPLFSDGQIPAFNDLVGDIDSLLKLKIHQVWFSVTNFVKRGSLIGLGPDVCKFVVVVDGLHMKRSLVRLKPS